MTEGPNKELKLRTENHRLRFCFDRYELSQDLLDKQIEMLERKYGGVKARNAALTIQRAFRRYTLLKKFAAITAMAKAEKRLSRKLQEVADRSGNLNDHERMVYHSQIYIQQTQSANR
jgi:IQ motif/SEC7 domain-containing protein